MALLCAPQKRETRPLGTAAAWCLQSATEWRDEGRGKPWEADFRAVMRERALMFRRYLALGL